VIGPDNPGSGSRAEKKGAPAPSGDGHRPVHPAPLCTATRRWSLEAVSYQAWLQTAAPPEDGCHANDAPGETPPDARQRYALELVHNVLLNT
jgi:hypothetical protein